MGVDALRDNTTGLFNTAVGGSALINKTTGNHNTAIGYVAGLSATTGSNDIYINNPGQAGDNGVIAIGEQGIQTEARIAGIFGTMIAGGMVSVDGVGRLGTLPSARRFKENIHDMDSASSAVMRLRPVTFRYKKAYANGERPLQYGLIAEEVAEVYRLRNRFSVIGLGTRFLRGTPIGQVQILPAG